MSKSTSVMLGEVEMIRNGGAVGATTGGLDGERQPKNIVRKQNGRINRFTLGIVI